MGGSAKRTAGTESSRVAESELTRRMRERVSLQSPVASCQSRQRSRTAIPSPASRVPNPEPRVREPQSESRTPSPRQRSPLPLRPHLIECALREDEWRRAALHARSGRRRNLVPADSAPAAVGHAGHLRRHRQPGHQLADLVGRRLGRFARDRREARGRQPMLYSARQAAGPRRPAASAAAGTGHSEGRS